MRGVKVEIEMEVKVPISIGEGVVNRATRVKAVDHEDTVGKGIDLDRSLETNK